MRDSNFFRTFVLATSAVCLQLSLLSAMAATSDRDQSDPPERVARLSYLKGRVALQVVEDDTWADASLNRPLTSGDRLRLEPNARAELQSGSINVQLDERAEFSFLELSDDVAQMRLTGGALYVSVRQMRDDEVIEVDTPQAAVAISKPGEYAIEIRDGGARTSVQTFSGECQVTDHRQTIALHSREQASFFGVEHEQVASVVEPSHERNTFDTWAHDRNQRLERSASSRYVDPDVIGYADLDDYGDWTNDADYGDVWYPTRVAVDWSPYRDGHWTWISPWGWTWVDAEPWGFAPFHYGRWANIRGRWCWVPGPRHVRPIYAPALVAWVGNAPPQMGVGAGVSFSIAFGSGIGWFPLAPREVYVPSYRCSRRHLYDVNYANTVIVNNVFINRAYNDRSTHFDHVNRDVRNAVTVVRPDTFMHSRPVREHTIRVDQRDLRNWETRNTIPDTRPRRDERARSNVSVESPRNIDRAHEREVITRHSPSERPAFNSFDVNRGVPTRDTMNRDTANRNSRDQGAITHSESQQFSPNTRDRSDRAIQTDHAARNDRIPLAAPAQSAASARERAVDRPINEPTRARAQFDRFQNSPRRENNGRESNERYNAPVQPTIREQIPRQQAPRQQALESHVQEQAPRQSAPQIESPRGREGPVRDRREDARARGRSAEN